MFLLIYVHVISYTRKPLYMHFACTLVTVHAVCRALCDQVSDLQLQLQLASELESNLQDTWTGAGSGLLILMLQKLN